MKTLIFFSILFSIIALPAFGQLTDADLDKIRLIVKAEVKTEITALKQELKSEIAAVKDELKGEIAAVEKELKGEIVAVKSELKDEITKSEKNVKEQITLLTYFVYALIALIVAAIAIPQIIMLWRSERERSLVKKVEILTQEVETLKQQQLVKP